MGKRDSVKRHMAHHHIDISNERTRLGELGGAIGIPALLIGVVGIAAALGIAFFARDPEWSSRVFEGYLVNYMFFLAIGLGGLFFTLIHHLTRAGWSVTVRRLAEGIAAGLPWMALLFLPIAWALFQDDISLFSNWASADAQEHDALVQHKAGYLNVPFFLTRAAVYFFIWAAISRYFWSLSVKQDASGDVELSHRMTSRSAPCMILFAMTLTLAAFDWMMTQNPHYFSTIWGVYFFAGAVAGFLAVAILLFAFLQRTGRLEHAVTTEHYHDLGKLLFAFGMVFWAYIAFSQYMLQWYGNLPEETNFWQTRASGFEGMVHDHIHGDFQPGAWNPLSLFLLIGHFAGPFVLMISRWPKRIKPLLCLGAGWMLLMCWFDLHWLIMPIFHPVPSGTFGPNGYFSYTDFIPLIGIGGCLLGMLALRMRRVSLLATGDPRLNESLAFENF